jgi:hypothetical protein
MRKVSSVLSHIIVTACGGACSGVSFFWPSRALSQLLSKTFSDVSLMHSRILLTARRGATGPSRAFSSTAKCEDKPILNRYSRTVTQTKDQGASQVIYFVSIRCGAAELRYYT